MSRWFAERFTPGVEAVVWPGNSENEARESGCLEYCSGPSADEVSSLTGALEESE